MMKASVIGASGLVGQALMRVLKNSGYEAIGTCRTRRLDGLVYLDLNDPQGVKDFLCFVRPKIIFLTAAMTNVDWCEDRPAETFRLNTEAPERIGEVAQQQGAKLVFYSTDYIFDGLNGPYSEEAGKSPVSIYGRAKAEAEDAIEKVLEDFLIIRTTVVYGWDPTSRNFAMQVYQKLQVGMPMEAAEDQWGNPTLVDYLAEASVRLVQQETRGIVNVVGKDLLSRSQFAKVLARVFGLDPELIKPVPTGYLGQRAQRPLRGGLRVEKLSRLLGTEAMPLEEALKRLRRQWRGEK